MTTATQSQLYTMKTLTDRKVVSPSGENLGEIQDFVVDVSGGCISYAVLSYATGFLNLRHKYFAVPWEAISIDTAHRDLILDVSDDMLKSAPGFDKDDWPSQPDDFFARSVYEHYGYEYPPRGPMGGGSGGQGGQGGYSEQGQQQGGYSEQQSQQPQQGNEPNRW